MTGAIGSTVDLTERVSVAPVPQPLGELLPAKVLVLREARATAVLKDHGVSLDLSVNAVTGEPVIYCTESGRYWSVSWRELIGHAFSLGIATKEAS